MTLTPLDQEKIPDLRSDLSSYVKSSIQRSYLFKPVDGSVIVARGNTLPWFPVFDDLYYLLLDELLIKVRFRSSVTALLPLLVLSSLTSTPESKLVSRLSTGRRLRSESL